jgi:ApaG protein
VPPNSHAISVSAQSTYLAEQSDPARSRFVFGYTITIENTGRVTAQLISRHWIITDALGKVQEVRGEGVVGEQPELQPGEAFQYTSGCPLATPVGSMRGSYQCLCADGSADGTILPTTGDDADNGESWVRAPTTFDGSAQRSVGAA